MTGHTCCITWSSGVMEFFHVLFVCSNYTDNRIGQKKYAWDYSRACYGLARWLEYFQLLMHTVLSIVALTEWTFNTDYRIDAILKWHETNRCKKKMKEWERSKHTWMGMIMKVSFTKINRYGLAECFSC